MIEKLIELTDGKMDFSINPHRETTPKGDPMFSGVVDYFDQHMLLEDLPQKLVNEMVKKDRIVEITFTPRNPKAGVHFTTFNSSLELAIAEAIKSLEKDGKRSDNIDELDGPDIMITD